MIVISNLYYKQQDIEQVTQIFDLVEKLYIKNISNLNKLLFVSVDFEFSRLDNSIGLVQLKFDQLGLQDDQLKQFNELVQDKVIIIELRKVSNQTKGQNLSLEHMKQVQILQERFLFQFLFNCQDNVYKIAQGPFSGDVPNLNKKYGKQPISLSARDQDKVLFNPVRYFVKNMIDINLFYNILQKLKGVSIGGALYGFYSFSNVLSKEKIVEIKNLGQRGMNARRELGDISVLSNNDYLMYCYYDVRYLFECLLHQRNEQKLTGQEFMFLCSYISLISTLRLFPFEQIVNQDKTKVVKKDLVAKPFNPFKYSFKPQLRGGKDNKIAFEETIRFINIPSNKETTKFSIKETIESGMFDLEKQKKMKAGGNMKNIMQKKEDKGLTLIIQHLLEIKLSQSQQNKVNEIIDKMSTNRIFNFLIEDTHHKKVIIALVFYYLTMIDHEDNELRILSSYLSKRLEQDFALITKHILYYNLLPMKWLQGLLAREIALKAIKTYNESQFMLRIITENTMLGQYSEQIKKNVNLVNLLRYKFCPKNSIIYETGDFGQYYYFLLSGKLLQLLPINEDIAISPVKISAQKTPYKLELSLLNIMKQNESNLGRNPKMGKNNSQKDKNNNSFSMMNSSMSQIMEKEFQQYVPNHKFNQYILPGQGFGDSELFSKLRRGCTIFCEEDSHLVILQKEDFQQFMGNEKNDLINQKIHFLKQFDFLESIPNTKLMQILDTSITLNLNSKNMIYQEGQDSESIYFIRKGEVTLTQIIEPNSQQEEQSNQIGFNEELDLYTAMNKRKKKQERVPILIISENSCFGEYEILKKISQKTTQAVCTSQESEIIEIKISNLLPIVKTFGKFKHLKQLEKVRDKFMEERLQLILSQKREQNITRQNLNQLSLDNNTINKYQIKRKPSLQFSTPKTQFSQNTIYQSSTSSISQSDLFPLRNKIKTQGQELGKQNFSFSKLTFSPSQQQIKIDEFSKSNNTSPCSINVIKSEKQIGMSSIFNPDSKARRQLYNKQSTFTHQHSSFYDFSIKDSKNQIIEEIQQKQINHNKQNSLQFIFDQQQNQIDQKEQKRNQEIKQINQQNLVTSSKQIVTQYQAFHKKCKSSTLIQIPIQLNKDSVDKKLNIFKNDFKLNQFESYVENAEKQVQQKQEVLQMLSQNNTKQQKIGGSNNNNSNNRQNNISNSLGLFDEEFQKGFNKMYQRKFGKKYEKN